MLRWLRLLPALGWAILLLFLGSRPDLPGPDLAIRLDKIAHFLAYGVLGGLAAWGCRGGGICGRRSILLVIPLLVGVADELNQSRVPGRSAELADWLADCAGVLLAYMLVWLMFSNREEKGRA